MIARLRMCPRCDQVLVPGELAPWCLGGKYRCDPSEAVVVDLVPVPAPYRPGPAEPEPVDPTAMTDEQVLADLQERGEEAPTARSLRNRYGMRHDRAARLVAEHANRADRPAGTGVRS